MAPHTFLWPPHTRDQLFGILLPFIEAQDHEFDPPLSSRVLLDRYAKRLAQHAEVLLAAETDLQSPVGICAFYCNDMTSERGYISYLGVTPPARHHKTGQQLVQRSLEVAWSRGMRSVELHTTPNDPRLQQFYERSGFAVVEAPIRSAGERLLMRAAASSERAA